LEKRSLSLVLMSSSHAMNHVYQLLTPIIVSQIASEYLLSNAVAGIIVSVYSLSYALLQTVSGLLSKTLGRKNTIIVGFVITSVAFLVLGFVNNLILFAIVLFIAGMGGSTYHPNGMPLLAEYYEENRGQAAGFHQTGGSLGSFVAPLVIGPLVVILNWRLTIAVLAIPGIVLSLVLWLLLVEPKQQAAENSHEQQANQSKKVNLKMYGSSLIFIGAALLYTVGIRGVDSLGVLYFQRGRGITDYVEATFLFSMFKVAGLFSAPICGKLSDILGRKKAIAFLVCIEAASLYTLTLVPNSLLIAPCLVFGFASFGLLAITDAFLADITPKEYMATVFGLNFTLTFFTQVIIPPIFGAIVDYTKSFDIEFVILSAIVLFSIPILSKVKAKTTLK